MTTTTTDLIPTAHDFRSTQLFDAPPAKVVEALTTTDGISDWWARTTGSAAQGGELSVWFGERQMRGRVTVTDRPTRVQWDVVFCDAMPDWVGTTVIFEVAPLGEGSVLSFTHVGLNPQLECFAQCFAGWTFYLGRLVDYVDNDGGTPACTTLETANDRQRDPH